MATMEEISSLKIKGGIFTSETDLPLLKKKQEIARCSLLYGKNGSGKSTVAKGFRKVVGEDEKQIESVELIDEKNMPIGLTEEMRSNIYVFDEDFVNDNIRIEGDGLNSIIVMGAVKGADDKIKRLQPDYDKSIELYNNQVEKLHEYEDANNPISPDYYINEMMNKLKGDDNWAGRDAKIRDKRTNSPVKRDTYKQFVTTISSKTRDELIVEFDELLRKLEQAKSGSKIIEGKVPTLNPFVDIEEKIIRLLAIKIEKPELSERERYLFSILEGEGGNQRLNQIKQYFTTEEKRICPFCFQNVEEDYASGLVASIEKILSKKVEAHQSELRKVYLSPIDCLLDEFEPISKEFLNDCKLKIEQYNLTVSQINDLLIQKSENVFIPIETAPFNLKEKYDDCCALLKKLEESRLEFNKTATDTTALINQLLTVNSEIAHYDILNSYNNYLERSKARIAEQSVLERYQVDKEAKIKEMEDLEQEKKDARIAMRAINDDLAYIFFSKERLKIEFHDDKYFLYSHGLPVEPNHVSVGERNAIGLCYYFNRIMENKKEEDVFKRAYLLVIDDPVSSFDTENRIGILSYIKYKLGQFLTGHEQTRSLLMTHDLQTFFDTKHILEEILTKIYGSEKQANKRIIELELKNNNIQSTEISNRSEYTSLFEIIFKYGEKVDTSYSQNIGNIMRKVMEAYGTFVYKQGMAQLSTNDKIISSLSKEDQKYFENLMYRLVLNSGSHMKERVETIEDMKFFDYISESDKQRTARDIICFLYKLNPLHVLAHLKNCEKAEETIKRWCKDMVS